MGEVIPDPMRADKDDRHTISELKKSKKSSTSFICSLNINSLKNKTTILILVIFIVLLLISFFVFRSSTVEDKDITSPEKETPTEQIEPDANSDTQEPPTYQAIAPPPISRETTQTKVQTDNGNHLERLEIPGEITDQLAQKIIDINNNESNTRLQMNSQTIQTNDKYSELPLTKTLASTHYTLQLSGSSSLESLLNYAKKHKLTNYQIYETHKNNTPWFVLIKGNYPTLTDAKEALKTLPDALKTNSPWVKSGLSVQKEKQ